VSPVMARVPFKIFVTRLVGTISNVRYLFLNNIEQKTLQDIRQIDPNLLI
jgi:hypothetical protein